MSAVLCKKSLIPALCAVSILTFVSPVFGAKQTTLRLRTWWTGIDKIWQKDIIEPYEKANPHIKIDFKAIPWGEYWQKQLLMLSTGQCLGDVMLIDAKWTQDAIAGNFMIPLDPYIARDKDIKLNQFVQASLREYRKNLKPNGTLYGLPLISSAQVMYYNKDIFSQAGMTSPQPNWSWEDTFAYAKKLTKDRNGDGKPDQWGFGMDFYAIDCAIKAYGGEMVDDDFTKALIDRPEAIKAITAFQEGIRMGGVTLDWNAFFQGKVAMQNMGDWNMANFKNIKAKFNWDITIPPTGPETRASLAYSNGFFIPPFLSKQKQDEAWRFIKYIITTPRKSDLGLLYLAMMPSYKPLAQAREYLDGEPKCNRNVIMECNEKYAFTHCYPKNLEWHDKYWSAEWSNIQLLKKSPEQAAKAAADGINSVIARWRKKSGR